VKIFAMRTLLSCFLITLLSFTALSQDYNWFKQFGGTGDDRVEKTMIDSNGDIIAIGTFSGTVDFDPGIGVSEMTSNGWNDAFIVKFDTTGNLIWVRTLGGADFDGANVIEVDASDNIFVAGGYYGTIDIDPGAGEVLITSSGISAYLLKLDSNGDYQWSRNLTGSDVRISAIGTGPQGVVCAGTFHFTAEFNNEGTSVQLTSLGATDVYVMNLTNAGVFASIEQIGTPDQNPVQAFEMDASGNIYLASEYEGSIDIDPGVGTTTLTVNNVSNHGSFIAKYNSAMELQWGKNMNFPNYSTVKNMQLTPNNEIVFNGYFKDSISFNEFGDASWYVSAGDDDVFLGRIDLDGNGLWFKRYGNMSEDDHTGMHVGQSGNIYLFDTFEGTIDFDPGIGVSNAHAVGDMDGYILCLDGNGDLIWFIQDSIDNQNYSITRGVVEGAHNDLYGMMNFYTEISLLQNGTTYSFASAGDYDILLMQLKTDSYLSVINLNEIALRAYPNPATDYLLISDIQNKAMPYAIYGIDGQLVCNGISNGSIDIRLIESGMYVLQIQNTSIRFVKE
jgi:hypothetical protein